MGELCGMKEDSYRSETLRFQGPKLRSQGLEDSNVYLTIAAAG